MWVRVRGTLGDRGTKGYHIRIPLCSIYLAVYHSWLLASTFCTQNSLTWGLVAAPSSVHYGSLKGPKMYSLSSFPMSFIVDFCNAWHFVFISHPLP
jgi:hypothetical protein